MPQSAAVSHLVFARARKGQSEQLGARLLALIEPSRNTSGCLSFALQNTPQDPDLWLISGSWASEDQMKTWLDAPHVQIFSEIVQTFMVSSLDFHTFATEQEAQAKASQMLRAI